MSAASNVAPDSKPPPKEDPWASVTSRIITKTPGSPGNVGKSRTMHKGRHHNLRNGEMGRVSALERAKLTAQRVAQSTDQAVRAVAGGSSPSSPSTGDKQEVQPEATQDSSLIRAKHTAKVVADSTAHAVEKLTGDSTAAVAVNSVHGAGVKVTEDGNDRANGGVEAVKELEEQPLRVDSRTSLGTKVQSWMDSMPSEEGGVGTLSLEKMTTTAEQVAESTASAVEKLSETLNGL